MAHLRTVAALDALASIGRPIVELRTRTTAAVELGHRAPRRHASLVADVLGTTAPGAAAQQGVDLCIGIGATALAASSLLEAVEALQPDERPRVLLEVGPEEQLIRGEPMLSRIAALRRLGVRFGIDRFGEGWANLAMVATLAPERIKVPLPLLRGSGPMSGRWLSGLADGIGAMAVVTGIDTEPDGRSALALGSTFGQGALWDAALWGATG